MLQSYVGIHCFHLTSELALSTAPKFFQNVVLFIFRLLSFCCYHTHAYELDGNHEFLRFSRCTDDSVA